MHETYKPRISVGGGAPQDRTDMPAPRVNPTMQAAFDRAAASAGDPVEQRRQIRAKTRYGAFSRYVGPRSI